MSGYQITGANGWQSVPRLKDVGRREEADQVRCVVTDTCFLVLPLRAQGTGRLLFLFLWIW